MQNRKTRLVSRVTSFKKDAPRLTTTHIKTTKCVVRVTHASVGSTDIMARRGDYLLHPLPGFISGYDFVGILETADKRASKYGLSPGQRVAGILPNMGAHASLVKISSSLLVPVPASLTSELAATLPLDGVTAKHALDLMSSGGSSIFISGISGAVGILAAQMAKHRGMRVIGTGSPSLSTAKVLADVKIIDYHKANWPDRVLKVAGPVDGAIDHTGSPETRKVLAKGGRLVRTAFGGRAGRQKKATAIGFATTLVRRYASPNEIICSIPMYAAVKRASYRRDLKEVLSMAASGHLTPLTPSLYDSKKISRAIDAVKQQKPGVKIVLNFSE